MRLSDEIVDRGTADSGRFLLTNTAEELIVKAFNLHIAPKQHR